MVDQQEHDPFIEDDDWEDDDAVPVRSTGRFVTQIILLLIGVGLFLWLVNILGDGDVWPGVVDWMSRGAWIAVLLILLVILLIVVILLLKPAWVTRALDGRPIFDDDPLYMVGCPGCGTTFDRRHHEIDEPHEKRFQCPNCNRVGELRSMKKRRAHVEDHWCTQCDKHYTVYQDHSECPHCHAAQEHPLQ